MNNNQASCPKCGRKYDKDVLNCDCGEYLGKRRSWHGSTSRNENNKIVSCPNCGRKHDKSVLSCDCGENLQEEPLQNHFVDKPHPIVSLIVESLPSIKKFLFRPIIGYILAVSIIFLLVSCSELNKKRTIEVRKESTAISTLLKKSQDSLQKLEIDNALPFLIDIEKNKLRYKENTATYNLALTLKDQIVEYKRKISDGQVNMILRNLSDSDYSELCNHNLHGTFFEPEQLNTDFLNLLYKGRLYRVEYIEQKRREKIAEDRKRAEDERQARIAEQRQKYEEEQALSSVRKAYQQLLRNSYLDAGMDIQVQVSGRNNTRLTLTYVLFNDVWARKIQTAGNLDSWRSMGFKRVALQSGYDYGVYWDL